MHYDYLNSNNIISAFRWHWLIYLLMLEVDTNILKPSQVIKETKFGKTNNKLMEKSKKKLGAILSTRSRKRGV